MNILIDADGCPVVDLTLQIAKQFGVPGIILCDACASLMVMNGVSMKQIQEWLGDVPEKRMDRRIKFICPFDLAEHQGVEPWHRSPGLSHFECDLLRPLE